MPSSREYRPPRVATRRRAVSVCEPCGGRATEFENRLRELGHEEAAPPPLPPPEVDVETMRKIKQAVVELIGLVEEP